MEDKLTEQVKILTQTVETMIGRMEQTFKAQTEQSKILQEISQKLETTIGKLEVTDEALKRSLSDNDQQIDDLAKITAAQLKMFQQAPESEQ